MKEYVYLILRVNQTIGKGRKILRNLELKKLNDKKYFLGSRRGKNVGYVVKRINIKVDM